MASNLRRTDNLHNGCPHTRDLDCAGAFCGQFAVFTAELEAILHVAWDRLNSPTVLETTHFDGVLDGAFGTHSGHPLGASWRGLSCGWKSQFIVSSTSSSLLSIRWTHAFVGQYRKCIEMYRFTPTPHTETPPLYLDANTDRAAGVSYRHLAWTVVSADLLSHSLNELQRGICTRPIIPSWLGILLSLSKVVLS